VAAWLVGVGWVAVKVREAGRFEAVKGWVSGDGVGWGLGSGWTCASTNSMPIVVAVSASPFWGF
jgi:hypothetical protein